MRHLIIVLSCLVLLVNTWMAPVALANKHYSSQQFQISDPLPTSGHFSSQGSQLLEPDADFDHALFLPLVVRKTTSLAYLEKIFTIANYNQTDPAYGGLPGGGLQYCSPTAVSNSIVWLDSNGFDNLMANSQDSKKDQFDLIQVLGSPGYMNTNILSGTGANQLLNGVKKYILDHGYTYDRLQYGGWRYHSEEFDASMPVPSMDWIKNGVRGNGSVWINIGWYSYDSKTDVYVRNGGHWVTLVGYGHDSTADHPDYLIIHDPARARTNEINNLYLLPQLITSGTLVGNYTGLPQNASGYHKIAPEVFGNLAIIDGAVILEMPTAGQTMEIKNIVPVQDVIEGN